MKRWVAALFLIPTCLVSGPVRAQPGGTPQSRDSAVSLEGSSVPAFICFTAILEREPTAIVPTPTGPAQARIAWGLDGEELAALSRSRLAWEESRDRIGHEVGARSETLLATAGELDEEGREAFRQVQLEGLRRKVDAAFDALRILEQAWDADSLEALRQTVLECDGVSLGTAGPAFDPESMELYKLMDVRFGKAED